MRATKSSQYVCFTSGGFRLYLADHEMIFGLLGKATQVDVHILMTMSSMGQSFEKKRLLNSELVLWKVCTTR